MVHERQRLPLLLEALQDRFGVHACLDQLERHLALDWLGLLGDPDLAHAPFADLFLQRVASRDDNAGHGHWAVIGGLGGWERRRSSGPGVSSRVASARAWPGPDSTVWAGRLSRILLDFSCAASSASTAARISGRPSQAFSRKAAHSSGDRDNASSNRVSSFMAGPRARRLELRSLSVRRIGVAGARVFFDFLA